MFDRALNTLLEAIVSQKVQTKLNKGRPMYLTEAIFINTLQVHLQFLEKADLFAKFNEEQISNEIFRDIK